MNELHNLYEKLKKQKRPEKEDKIRIVIFTNAKEDSNDGKLSGTTARIKEECDKKKIENYVLFSESASIIRSDEGVYTIYNKDDKKGFEVDYENTVIFVRGYSLSRLARDLLSQLEKAGLFIINNRESIEMCNDKYRTILRLGQAGLPYPKTALLQSIDTLDYALEQIGENFPLIVKTLSGAKGVGVFFIESIKSLKALIQFIWKIDEDEELLIQEYIDTPYDLRVHVFDKKVIAVMKRFMVENDFRSNYSQGGKVEKAKISKEIEEIAINAARSVNAVWAGVDIIQDKKGNPYIIEVNSSPGTEGAEEATGKNIIDEIIEYIKNKDVWTGVAQEVGHREIVDVMGIQLRAKFDTGNSSRCVLHTEKWEVENGIVKWSTLGKKFEKPLFEYVEVRKGGIKMKNEKRPAVLLDLTFGNTIYKDVEFTLDDRSDRISGALVLMNRKAMTRMNVMVNPAKMYVLTTDIKD